MGKTERKQIKEGLYRTCAYTDKLMTAVVEFTNGPWDEPEPPHSHVHEQVSYVAKGEIIYYCEDQAEKHLKPGDMFIAPSGKKHTVKLLTEEVTLIDSFTPIREEFL